MWYAIVLFAVISSVAAGFGCHTVRDDEQSPLFRGGDWVMSNPTDEVPELEGRWTLLAFFQPSDENCLAEVPHLVSLQNEYEQRGLTVVGLTAVDSVVARRFLRKHELTYDVLSEAGVNFEAYGVTEVPQVFLLSPHGDVLARDRETAEAVLAAKFNS